MAYDLYPAVDENYNFPPEVRAALAKALELRNTVVPMTQTERNNLTAPELWDGRLILNTTSERINRYDASDALWRVVAEESDSILYFTEVQRDNLSGGELWDNRLILNTTTSRINRYDAPSTSWISIVEPSELYLILTTNETPKFTISGGDIGTSQKAARADHRHPSPAAPQTDVFTFSGTWNKPPGAVSIDVYIIGSGGGGVRRGISSSGSGGGGGGVIIHTFDASQIASTVTVTVGTGGRGEDKDGINGVAAQGGTTSFGSYMSIVGGMPGVTTTGGSGSGVGYYAGGKGGDGLTVSVQGGTAIEGAGGGAGSLSGGSGTVSGGTSMFAGKGGDSQNGSSSTIIGGSGVAPGGGGGCGTQWGGSGARGEVRIRTNF